HPRTSRSVRQNRMRCHRPTVTAETAVDATAVASSPSATTASTASDRQFPGSTTQADGNPSRPEPIAARLPAVNLPKGGGSVRGMGEKFNVNAATGNASLTIPVTTSAGRSGFGPQLQLNYESGAGNGPFG